MKLHTERLVLRNFKEIDISEALEYLSDPEVMKYIEPIFDYEKAKEFINDCGLGQEPLVYALVHKVQNKVIGHIIFHEFNDSDEFELGWIINKEYWGQGFAAEISRELISYGFNVLGLKTIIAEAKEDNIRSIRVMESLGMKKSNTYNKGLTIWSISK